MKYILVNPNGSKCVVIYRTNSLPEGLSKLESYALSDNIALWDLGSYDEKTTEIIWYFVDSDDSTKMQKTRTEDDDFVKECVEKYNMGI